MNRISLRIVSLTALSVGAFFVAQGCASEQTSFNGVGNGDGGPLSQGGGFGSGGQFGGTGGATGNGGAVTGNGGTVTGNGGTVTGNGGTVTGNGGTVTGNGGTVTGNGGSTSGGSTGNGGSGGVNSCKPSFCPASGSGSPCCTSSGSCGVDFGMGCTTPPRDGGTP